MKRGGTDEIILKGVLEKVNKIGFHSKKLCVLSKTEFYYYADQKAHGTIKRISLQDVQAVKRDYTSKGFQFEVITRSKTETYAAESLDICQHWLKAIQSTLLTNRRLSVTSASSVCSDPPKSPLSQYGGHGYEVIDMDDKGQPVLSGYRGSSVKSPVQKSPAVHSYETVDVDTEEKSMNPGPTRGVCTTVDALGGPPSTKLAPVQISPPLSTSSAELPLYSEVKKTETLKPSAVKSKPLISPKPVSYKVDKFKFDKELPDTTGLCRTVDGLRGPLPKVSDGNSSPSPQSVSPEEGLYSEVLSEKRSDLYFESKRLNAEQHGRGTDKMQGKGSELCDEDHNDRASSCSGGYSTTYSTVKELEPDMLSDVQEVQKREQPKTHSGIYSFAQPIDSDISTVPVTASKSAEDVEYSDALSCGNSTKLAKETCNQPTFSVTDKAGTESVSTNSNDTLRDVNSNPIPEQSLLHGPVNRSDAISKLEQFLTTFDKTLVGKQANSS